MVSDYQRRQYEKRFEKEGKSKEEINEIISKLEELPYKEYCGTGLKKYQILYGEKEG